MPERAGKLTAIRMEEMMGEFFGREVKKLGFGLMRLPKNETVIDVDHVSRMADAFLENGFTYFDTAFVYEGSEEAIRKALVERHPRESYTLATKLNAFMFAENEEMAKSQFEKSLERTGAGYFDFYLLHALMSNNYQKYTEYHLWDYVKELKSKGLIKHYGFSFHAGPELLDQLLTEHPEVDFIQLQINYADWENPEIASRANYEVARKHGKPIVVMEPVKGGTLADPPSEVKRIFDEVNPGVSYASWAIRFVASLDGILTVLSGMSNMEQMQDNLSYMKDFVPLNEKEKAAIKKAQDILGASEEIPCTACHYCTEGCPQQIAIPDIFKAMNRQISKGELQKARKDYQEVTESAKASDCIQCGQCESACPQHLPIIRHLQKCAMAFE